MAPMRDKLISNEKEDFGALNRPQFSLYFSRLGDTRDRLSCNSDAPSSGNKLTSYFSLTIGFWPSDICTPPKIHSLSAQFVGLPPSRVWVLLKVFSGIIWLPHIIHNYPSTIKNTTKDHTQDMVEINVWSGCKWYQAPWSARLLIIFQFFLQFPRRVVAAVQGDPRNVQRC